MGYFSDLDLMQQVVLDLRTDKSYPSPRETFQWYLEDLTEILDQRGVSAEQLTQAAQNGWVDYFEPQARYHYWQIEAESSTKELIMAVGELAVRIQEERHYELMRELQTREALPENSEVALKLSA